MGYSEYTKLTFNTVVSNYKNSFHTYKKKYLLSALFDLLAVLVFFAVAALFYWLFAFLYEVIALRVGPFTFVFLLGILFIFSFIALVSSLSIPKYFSYNLWQKTPLIPFKQFYRLNLLWAIPWFILYLFVALAFTPAVGGYLLVAGFVVYAFVTSLLRWHITPSFRTSLIHVRLALGKADVWFAAGAIFATLFIALMLIAAIFAAFTASIGVALSFNIALVLLYLLGSSWAKNYMYQVLHKK